MIRVKMEGVYSFFCKNAALVQEDYFFSTKPYQDQCFGVFWTLNLCSYKLVFQNYLI